MLPINTIKEVTLMSPKSKEEYTFIIAKRYKRAKFSAKSAIRKLNNFKFFQKKKKSKPRPKPIYNKKEIINPLRTIWLKANLPCSKNLKADIKI